MVTGVQWTDTLGANETRRWFTGGWIARWHVVWYMMPTSSSSGTPQLDWDIAVERTDSTRCTYWITVNNLTSNPVTFEARYAILAYFS